jgi:hypothetical protein
MPYLELLDSGRRWALRRWSSSESAAEGSSTPASPCLSRCRTLLTTTLAEILAPPSAM